MWKLVADKAAYSWLMVVCMCDCMQVHPSLRQSRRRYVCCRLPAFITTARPAVINARLSTVWTHGLMVAREHRFSGTACTWTYQWQHMTVGRVWHLWLPYYPCVGSSRCVGRVISGVCDSVCVCVCVCVFVYPCYKRKMTWAINTKLGRHTVHVSRSACVDPELKMSHINVTWLSRAHA